MQKEKLEKLAGEKSKPCITVSLNTHRTHPDNTQDVILLKNLLKEARQKVVSEFGKHDTAKILEKIESIEKNVDPNYNLESLHLFISDSTTEVIKSPLPTPENKVQVSDRFAIQPLMKMLDQTEEYLILLLSQSDVKLYHAVNDSITGEVRIGDFPFKHQYSYATDSLTISEAGTMDNLLRDYLNKVDKAIQNVYNQTGLGIVVISTVQNFGHLREVMDRPAIYLGHSHVNYNHTENHHLAAQAWEIVRELNRKTRTDAIRELKESVGAGLVTTDLGEIYRAAKEGRADLLIIDNSFRQAAKIKGDSLDPVSNGEDANVDDITGEIAWLVSSKKGRVIFTDPEELDDLGKIALKLRY